MNNPIIAPSVLAADFRNLSAEIGKINESSAEWIHFDVMDGVFVPNISFGFPILEAVASLTKKFIDVHLMIQNPHNYFESFQKAGAHGLTIHFEGNDRLKDNLTKIRNLGLQVGLVINPATPVSVLEPYLEYIDMLLIMAVEPGFGGQSFIENTYNKVAEAKKMIEKSSKNIKLQVDGGVSIANSKGLIDMGADVLVCGSALFRAADFSGYVEELRA